MSLVRAMTVLMSSIAILTLLSPTAGTQWQRIDCNRGRGTWMSKGTGNIEFGPLALTRALCPPESLHDRIVRQSSSVRSYLIKDGHLFLGLIADGGAYEFAPLVVR
jgi:para-nitrobenzyl esterase